MTKFKELENQACEFRAQEVEDKFLQQVRKAIEEDFLDTLKYFKIGKKREIKFTTTNQIGIHSCEPKISDEKLDRLDASLNYVIDSDEFGYLDLDFVFKNGVFTWGKWW